MDRIRNDDVQIEIVLRQTKLAAITDVRILRWFEHLEIIED